MKESFNCFICITSRLVAFEGGHDVVFLVDPVLVLVDPQLAVGVDDPGTIAAVVEEALVLVLALHVVQHVALQLGGLSTDGALPPLQPLLHHDGHVGQEGTVSLRGRGVAAR